VSRRDPAELETLLLPLVNGCVRVTDRGATSFARGEVTTAERFVAGNEQVMAAGKSPAVAEAVFLGLSELG
jgi:hypothetical protein